MKNLSRATWAVLFIAGVVLIAGCTPQTVERDARYQVTGTVTLNGEPVEGAAVAFVPKGPGDGAMGTTDAQGKYTLTTYGGNDGALPGEYAVKITKYEGAATAEVSNTSDESGDTMYPADYDGAVEDTEASKNLLPAKYADMATSGFEATVEPNDNNVYDFAMEGSAE